EGALLHGTLRTEAQRWLAERSADLTLQEREFITWDERDEYQIEQVLSKGLDLIRFSRYDSINIQLIRLAVRIDPAGSLKTAREISDVRARAGVIGTIAAVLAQAGDAEQALEAARGIADVGARAEMLGTIAAVLAQAGHAEQALEAARGIAD